MTAFRQLAFACLLSAGASSSLDSFFMVTPVVDTSSEIRASTELGRALLDSARRLENADGDDSVSYLDTSYLKDYSLKFQGCHHIPEWNKYVQDENDLRISTHRLVRFRLCPASSCQDSKSAGCSSKYGDYIVDMNTFVYSFLYARQEARQNSCNQYQNTCETMCDGNDDENSCQYQCFAGYGLSYCMQDANASAEDLFDPINYAKCAQYEMNNNGERDLEEYYQSYYIGPYCADQGGSIHLGLFLDNTCTSESSNGKETFYSKMGFELPYSTESLISYDCVTCQETVSVKQTKASESTSYGYSNAAEDAYGYNADNNAYGYSENANADAVEEYYYKDVQQVKYFCESIYALSGKCEAKMAISNINDNACNYIEGIKIVRDNGVIRTHSVRSSKTASVVIGLFTTLAVLLGAYVFYLRNSEYK